MRYKILYLIPCLLFIFFLVALVFSKPGCTPVPICYINQTILVEDGEATHGWACEPGGDNECTSVAASTDQQTQGAKSLKVSFTCDPIGGIGWRAYNVSFAFATANLQQIGLDFYVADSQKTPSLDVEVSSYDCYLDTKTISNGWNRLTWSIPHQTDCSRAVWDSLGTTTDFELRGEACNTAGSSAAYIDNITFTYKIDNPTDWIIDNEECTITSESSHCTDLYLINNGNLTLDANVTFIGSNQIIAIDSGSKIVINKGGGVNSGP